MAQYLNGSIVILNIKKIPVYNILTKWQELSHSAIIRKPLL